MAYAILFVVGIPLFALAFSAATMLLGLFSDSFQTSGDGGFKTLYCKFLIVAAVYILLSVFGIGGVIGLAVMAFAYKVVFAAGWTQAVGIGIVGGIFGWVLFVVILVVLAAMGMPIGQ